MVVISCGPSVNGVSGVNVQLPTESTVVVPNGLPLSITSTVAPGSPLPVIVGVLSSVVPPDGISPTFGPTLSVAPTPSGWIGTAVSIVIFCSEIGPIFPAPSTVLT